MRNFLLLFLFCVGLMCADSDIKKAVFDLTTSNLLTFESRLVKGVAFNNSNYQSTFKELDILVVIHGDAYKFFVKDLSKTKLKVDEETLKKVKELHERLFSLVKTYNVKFMMCGVGMKSREISKENILDFIEVTPSAMIGLIDAQNDGYAYIPIH